MPDWLYQTYIFFTLFQQTNKENFDHQWKLLHDGCANMHRDLTGR
jgi:hypothetical protein